MRKDAGERRGGQLKLLRTTETRFGGEEIEFHDERVEGERRDSLDLLGGGNDLHRDDMNAKKKSVKKG